MSLQTVFGFILRRRALVLGMIGALTVLAVFYATRVSFDSSIEIWFLENDPSLVTYRDFLDRFSADEVAVIGVFGEDVFTPEVLALLTRITRAAQKAPHAHRVRSLANIKIAVGEGGMIDIAPLYDEPPKSREEAEEIRRRALSSSILVGGMLAPDCKATAVVVELSGEGGDFIGKIELTEALRAIVAREQLPGISLLLAGSPVLDDAFYKFSKRDSLIFGPLTLLIVIVFTFFVFRRISAAIIPLVVVALAATWIFGIMGFLGIDVNVISTALLGLILAVGVADSVHILAEYYQKLMEGIPPDQAVEKSLTQLFMPCLFTSATTSAGLLSLLISDLRPIRQFGWLAALAVFFAFFLSFTFIPAILRLAKPPDPAYIERQRRGPISRVLRRLGSPTRKSSIIVLATALILMIPAVWGLSQIRVGANPMKFFRKDDPVRVDMEKVDSALGGTVNIEGFIHTRPEGMKDPDILRRLDTLQRWLEGLDGITQVLSVVDMLKDLNKVMFDGDPKAYRLPETRAMVAQYYLLLEGEDDFDSYVQENYSVARLTGRVRMSDSEKLTEQIPLIRRKLSEEYNDADLRVEITGFIKLMSDMEKYLMRSQIRSFSIAFLVISVMMLLLLRSPRLALFSFIPNILPIFMGLAFMGLVGIDLDPGTVMIGCIALGLVVDDTVHFLVRLRRHIQDGKDMEDSVRHTMDESGRPIIVTSLVLVAGFLVLTMGSFMPNVHFGLITGVVILLALVADLVVLPAALIVIRPNFDLGGKRE